MEKLRMALEILKKYHFWILCGLIVLITFGTWYMATDSRATAYTTRKTAIEGKISSIKSIGAKTDHPSEQFNKAIAVRESGNVSEASEDVLKLANIKSGSDSLSNNVSIAAKRLFDDQRSINHLPQIFENNAADQERFEAEFWTVWNHKIEDIEKLPEGANREQYELDKTFRDVYRNRIKDIFPKLFDMVDRRMHVDERNEPVPDGAGRGGFAGGGQAGDNTRSMKGTVDWPGAEELMKRFEIWTDDIPTTLQVMLAQEDLWVYEALLKVIRNTNNSSADNGKNYRPPASHKLARIKEIQALEIGNDAAQSWTNNENSVINLGEGGGAAASAEAGMAPGGQQSPMGSGMGRGLPPGTSGMGRSPSYLMKPTANAAASAAPSAMADRYVGNDGKPLADFTDKTKCADEFRMMPINMRVIIEQKEIPRLLVELANSSMRIDVRAVRVLAEPVPAFNPSGTAAAAETPAANPSPAAPQMQGGRGGREGPMGPMRGRMEEGPRPMRGIAGGGDNRSSNPDEESADPAAPPVPVEIQGIIYIYNPPASTSPNGEATAAAGTAPAATAPGAPAVPAAPVGGTPPAAAAGPATPPVNGARP